MCINFVIYTLQVPLGNVFVKIVVTKSVEIIFIPLIHYNVRMYIHTSVVIPSEHSKCMSSKYTLYIMCMDGWMDRWMYGWMDGWMDR